MDKPKMKKEIALDCAIQTSLSWSIYFYASQDAVVDVSTFGKVTSLQSKGDWYLLEVDRRFDFNEVVAYIQNYG